MAGGPPGLARGLARRPPWGDPPRHGARTMARDDGARASYAVAGAVFIHKERGDKARLAFDAVAPPF